MKGACGAVHLVWGERVIQEAFHEEEELFELGTHGQRRQGTRYLLKESFIEHLLPTQLASTGSKGKEDSGCWGEACNS